MTSSSNGSPSPNSPDREPSVETEPSFDGLEADLAQIVEALVFASDDTLPEDVIRQVYHDVTGEDWPGSWSVVDIVDGLNEQYVETGRVMRIQRWGGGYRMATEPLVEPFLRALFTERKQRRLSRALLESLAVVAYRQPVAKPVVDLIRGVDSDYAIRRLLDYALVEIVGRSDSIGRPLLYGTTDKFLDLFGLDTLDALPKLQELSELVGDIELDPERIRFLDPDTPLPEPEADESQPGTDDAPEGIEGDG